MFNFNNVYKTKHMKVEIYYQSNETNFDLQLNEIISNWK